MGSREKERRRIRNSGRERDREKIAVWVLEGWPVIIKPLWSVCTFPQILLKSGSISQSLWAWHWQDQGKEDGLGFTGTWLTSLTLFLSANTQVHTHTSLRAQTLLSYSHASAGWFLAKHRRKSQVRGRAGWRTKQAWKTKLSAWL